MRGLILFLLVISCFPIKGQEVRFFDLGKNLDVDVPFSRGAAIVDFNNDGFEDLFITRKGRNNCLFQNMGDGTFQEVGNEAKVAFIGASSFATWADYDNDGWEDFYLATSADEPNRLYRNKGNGTFEEVTSATETRITGLTIGAIWGDVNNDGWLDLYVLVMTGDNHLLINQGDGTFQDSTSECGLYGLRLSMGTVFIDYDLDNDLDVYATHDGSGNLFFENDGTGHFTEVSEKVGLQTKSQAMGVAVGDFNNDGWPDLYLTNLYHNDLFKNNGDGTFSEVSDKAGIEDEGMGWGVSWLDYNNDGLLDLYIANDSDYSAYSNALFKNNGDETFTRVGQDSDLASNGATYGTSIGDINRDGKPDILISNQGKTDVAQLFINAEENQNHWLRLKLQGSESNRSAIGAKVLLHSKGKTFSRVITSGGSWAADDSHMIHFGLGDLTEVEELKVTWPNGKEEVFTQIKPDKAYKIIEGESLGQLDYQSIHLLGEENIVTSLHLNEPQISNYIDILSSNPFHDSFQFELNLKQTQPIEISVMNAEGKAVKSLHQGVFSEGTHLISWNGTDKNSAQVESGFYFINVKGKYFNETLKLIKSH